MASGPFLIPLADLRTDHRRPPLSFFQKQRLEKRAFITGLGAISFRGAGVAYFPSDAENIELPLAESEAGLLPASHPNAQPPCRPQS